MSLGSPAGLPGIHPGQGTRRIDAFLTSPGDATYRQVNQALTGLDKVRDALARKVKGELSAAADSDTPVFGAGGQAAACQGIIKAAQHLAASS